MKRSELTVQYMLDKGWRVFDKNTSMDSIVKDIVDKVYKYLRCTRDIGTWVKRKYTVCSTYDVIYVTEYLEATFDNESWFKVAERDLEVSRKCVYSD